MEFSLYTFEMYTINVIDIGSLKLEHVFDIKIGSRTLTAAERICLNK